MDSSLRRKRQSPYLTPRSYKRRNRPPNACASSLSQGQRTSRIRPSSQLSSEPRQLADNTRDSVSGSRSLEVTTDDDFDQVIVAVDMKDSGTVGCSYYCTEEEKLYLLGDIKFAGTDTIDSRQLNQVYLPMEY